MEKRRSALAAAMTPKQKLKAGTPEAYLAANQALGARRIGEGIMSSGFGTSGGYGSPVMLSGGAMPAPTLRRDFSPAPLPEIASSKPRNDPPLIVKTPPDDEPPFPPVGAWRGPLPGPGGDLPALPPVSGVPVIPFGPLIGSGPAGAAALIERGKGALSRIFNRGGSSVSSAPAGRLAAPAPRGIPSPSARPGLPAPSQAPGLPAPVRTGRGLPAPNPTEIPAMGPASQVPSGNVLNMNVPTAMNDSASRQIMRRNPDGSFSVEAQPVVGEWMMRRNPDGTMEAYDDGTEEKPLVEEAPSWQSKSDAYAAKRRESLRTALSRQQAAADADPRIAENIARNQAASQRQYGGAPIVTDPAKRQEMFAREQARKEFRRGGIPNAMAGILANARNDPKTQGLLASALSGNEEAAKALGQAETSQMRDMLMAAEAKKLNAEAGAMERYNPDAIPPELEMQIQQTGEQARQAWLAGHPGDEAGATAAASQATAGRWKDTRSPAAVRNAAATAKPKGAPSSSGTPQSIIDDLRASGQDVLADRLEQQNAELADAERRARRARIAKGASTVGTLGGSLIGSGVRSLWDALSR